MITKTDRPLVIAVVGPTASGKTNLARFLAMQFNGEIVSADSRQIYKWLDIGTGKDGELQPNMVAETRLKDLYPQLRYIDTIPQWLTDFVDPNENFTVADFQARALEVIEDILERGKLPIITGGTGLYISALIEGYEFTGNQARDKNNPRHAQKTKYHKSPPNWDVLYFGTDLPRQELYERIDRRLHERIKIGLIDEGKALVQKGLTYDRMRAFGLEYRYLADLIEGVLSEKEFESQLSAAIHQFARRQLTWWRHHGNVTWVTSSSQAEQLLVEHSRQRSA